MSEKPLWIVPYSDTHEALFRKHFERSFDELKLNDHFELLPRHIDWNATYAEPGFNPGYREEIGYMAETFEENPGRLIVSSGCDFHFYRADILELIQKALAAPAELACIMDSGDDLCTCFFAAVSTPSICYFLREWEKENPEPKWIRMPDGQPRFNMVIRNLGIRVARLPDIFWTHGRAGMGPDVDPVWKGDDITELPSPPKDIVLHHGNFTVGAANKMRLLSEIERRLTAPKERFVLALQFWAGDRQLAMRLARAIADLEPTFRNDVTFLFVRRFDTTNDQATLDYVAKKFTVETHVGPDHTTGYPASPNLMALDLIKEANVRFKKGSWAEIVGMFMFEPDNVPLSKDWINELFTDFRAVVAAGKHVMGSWRNTCTPVGHINGNLCCTPQLAAIVDLSGCPTNLAWDCHFAPKFQPLWVKTGRILNLFQETKVLPDRLKIPEIGKERPSIVHGIKDETGWNGAHLLGLTK